MKNLKSFNEYSVSESVEININLWGAIYIYWLVRFIRSKKLTRQKAMSNIKSYFEPFCQFLALYGYPIDTIALENSFDKLMNKAFDKIDKLKK